MQLSTSESVFLRDMIRSDSSIVLDEGKDYLLETRLAPLMRTQSIDSFAELVRQLRRAPPGALRTSVVEAMTTNETSFFRDVHPWEGLRTDLIPQLIEAQRATRQLVFFCAACSSGQEPYTLAILLKEHFPEIATTWRIRIVCSDLSAEMVERTRAGMFSQLEVGRGLPASMLPKYFTRSGVKWQARDDLRCMIEASVGNLAEPESWRSLPQLDAVFLRNVLIYFSRDTKSQILTSVTSKLKSTGFLMLGSSESTVGVDSQFERLQSGKSVHYRLMGAGDGRATTPSPRAFQAATVQSTRVPALRSATPTSKTNLLASSTPHRTLQVRAGTNDPKRMP